MSRRRGEERLTYADSGVDMAAGEKAVEMIKAHVRTTFRPEVVGDIGGFGGLFSLGRLPHDEPLLVASTDGVGTKSVIAGEMGRFDTIGLDVVAMCVDDIATCGAEPLFFLDYISVGKLVPEHVDQIVSGVANGCREAGCALLGGEMSEHPGVMAAGEFDLVGFAVGVVDRSEVLPREVQPGDRVIGLASPGLRCNGYSLARGAFSRAGHALGDPAWRGARHTLGAELLRPSVIYAPAIAQLRRHVEVHAFAHVTGGGISGNLVRALPDDCDAIVERGRWEEPRIFSAIQAAGDITDDEMENVFNLGLGMLAIVPASAVHEALDGVRAAGHEAWLVGRVVDGHGRAHVEREAREKRIGPKDRGRRGLGILGRP
ncbi:MAG TPA: phosphoribosylformylglycinamidine cyclo-ligase [Acidimicrobiia bacterium]|nr:phosphoribosylformylglycinamidine cyclo-ligase [Acidimicrobiia bacterium]